jgi:hypothetical protein
VRGAGEGPASSARREYRRSRRSSPRLEAVARALHAVDLDGMTPVDALNLLHEPAAPARLQPAHDEPGQCARDHPRRRSLSSDRDYRLCRARLSVGIFVPCHSYSTKTFFVSEITA